MRERRNSNMKRQAGRLMIVVAFFPFLLDRPLPASQSPDIVERLRRARELLSGGKPEQAIPIYEQLSQEFPADAGLVADRAIAQYQAGRYQDAAGSASVALRLQPGLFPALLFLGASRLELGNATGAVGPLMEAAAARPQDRNAGLMLADALEATGRAAEALGHYQEAARTMPESPRVWYGLGRTYRALTVEAFRRVSAAAPGSAFDLALAADVERQRGQLPRAFRLYRRALAIDGTLPGAREAIAAIYESTGHSEWAVLERSKAAHEAAPECAVHALACDFLAGRYAAVAASSSDTPEAGFWKSRAYQRLAEEAHAKLRSLPGSGEAAAAEAEEDERRGAYRAAAAAWRVALQAAPKSGRVRRELAWALYHANDAAALPLLKELVGQDPESAELSFAYGAALVGAQEVEQATPLLERAVKLDPQLLPAQAALGQAYAQSGRAVEAIPLLQAAAATDSDGSLHYQLARALRASGRWEDAARASRRADQLREQLDQQAREAAITAP